MGLAASQARYLCLTARMSDLVFEGQQISQQRLQLTRESQEIAAKYSEAMNNTVMQAITPEGGTQQLTYQILTSKDPFTGLSMRLVDENGYVVSPPKTYTMTASSTDDNGEEVTETFASSSEFIKKYMNNISEDEASELSLKSLNEIMSYYRENYPDSTLTLSVNDNTVDGIKNDGERYVYDEKCLDPEYLQEMIISGQWTIQQPSMNEENEWSDFSWQSSTNIQSVMNTTDDAAAEAEYEAELARIQKRDKTLELRLEQIETEEQAVEKELESVKGIVKDNIQQSFQTFKA